jgi:calcyclin binding protein
MEEESPTQLDLDELVKLKEIASRPYVVSLISKEIEILTKKVTEERKAQADRLKQKSVEVASTRSNDSIGVKLKSEIPLMTSANGEFIALSRYAWDQEGRQVKYARMVCILVWKSRIYIDLENANSCENPEIKFQPHSVEIKLQNIGGKNYRFSISQLCDDIETTSSNAKFTAKRVIVTLHKKEAKHWDSLQYKKTDKSPVDKSDPQKGLMDMMKKLYEDGDEEMKVNSNNENET